MENELLEVYNEIIDKFSINKKDAEIMMEAYRMETISDSFWHCYGYKNKFEKSKVAYPVQGTKWIPNQSRLVQLTELGIEIVFYIDGAIKWKSDMCKIIRKKTYLKV